MSPDPEQIDPARVPPNLKCGCLIDGYLASWIEGTIKDPTAHRGVITDQRPWGAVIELQSGEGKAHGGILFTSPKGAVWLRPYLDWGTDQVTPRSVGDMLAAFLLAEKQRHDELAELDNYRTLKSLAPLLVPMFIAFVVVCAKAYYT